jgi:hypothetical protein
MSYNYIVILVDETKTSPKIENANIKKRGGCEATFSSKLTCKAQRLYM